MYSHPATCMVVFRDLPELSKQFIMRLLFIEQPIHQQMIDSWVVKTANTELEQAVSTMKDLKLWTETPGGLPSWILNETFRVGLRTCLFGGGEPWIVQPTSNDKHAKDVASLDSYAMERWEMVLHYMVGSKQLSNPKEKVGADTVATLVTGGLVTLPESSAGEAAPLITADGFQFLLLDTSSQVWYFMTKYLELVESKGLSLVECLTFMFQLSFCILGQVSRTTAQMERAKDVHNLCCCRCIRRKTSPPNCMSCCKIFANLVSCFSASGRMANSTPHDS